ncbi:MAG: hypothetical protein EPO28_09795 [Saprospiraceae bacterium]|nr:MAG: hypothetical protein EPO28_09795 [Saprospiraceae bacterium]
MKKQLLYPAPLGFVQIDLCPSSPPSAVRRGRKPLGARPQAPFAQNLLERSIAFALFSFLLAACGSDNSGNTGDSGTAVAPESIQLICQPVEPADTLQEIPHNEVFIQIGDSKIKVADIQSCETIAPESFAEYQIPANAIAAAGGWWAGFGDYIYVVQQGDNYLVKQGAMDEEQDNKDFGYHTVLTFTKEGKETL